MWGVMQEIAFTEDELRALADGETVEKDDVDRVFYNVDSTAAADKPTLKGASSSSHRWDVLAEGDREHITWDQFDLRAVKADESDDEMTVGDITDYLTDNNDLDGRPFVGEDYVFISPRHDLETAEVDIPSGCAKADGSSVGTYVWKNEGEMPDDIDSRINHATIKRRPKEGETDDVSEFEAGFLLGWMLRDSALTTDEDDVDIETQAGAAGYIVENNDIDEDLVGDSRDYDDSLYVDAAVFDGGNGTVDDIPAGWTQSRGSCYGCYVWQEGDPKPSGAQ